jgi:MerC mercury resistance protein
MVPVREPAAAPRAPSPLSPPLRHARGLSLDRLGVFASSLCALHCALMPALLVAAPALGVAFGGEQWEWPFLFASGCVGMASLVPSFLRSGRPSALVLFVAGAFLVLVGKLSFEAGSAVEGAFSALGAASIALAHLVNLRVVRARAHDHGEGAHRHGGPLGADPCADRHGRASGPI